MEQMVHAPGVAPGPSSYQDAALLLRHAWMVEMAGLAPASAIACAFARSRRHPLTVREGPEPLCGRDPRYHVGTMQRGRSAAASSRPMEHDAAATGRRPLVPLVRLELTITRRLPVLQTGARPPAHQRHVWGRSRSACPADERRRRLLAPGRPRKERLDC